MALSLSTEVQNAINSGDVASALLFEFLCETATRRAWNQHGDLAESVVTGSGVTWTGLGERIALAQPIDLTSDLQGQTLPIQIDASRINDDGDFLGALVDDTWHQRPVVVRQVLFAAGSDFTALVGVLQTWFGVMDRAEFAEFAEESVWEISAESGSYQFFRTNQLKRADNAHQRRVPGDRFYDLTAKQTLQSIPFGTSWSKVPGYNG